MHVWIGTKSEWDKNKRFPDQYSEGEWEVISQISDKLGIYEFVECCFTTLNDKETPQTIVKKLLDLGCSYNEEFAKMAKEY